MKYDVIIIGGNPAGASAASAIKQTYKDKSVLVIRKEQDALIPCGIPYALGSLPSVEADIKPVEGLLKKGIDFAYDEVISVNADEKTLKTAKERSYSYSKLIFATGSNPFVPPIPGADLDGVVTIRKDTEYIKSIREDLRSAENLIVIGAGFIGVEVCDELAKFSGKVTLIEAMDSILPLAFDKDMSDSIENKLNDHGVTIMKSAMVSRIGGENGKVSQIDFSDGSSIPADRVILSIGYRPNTALAGETGLMLGSTGGIWTDEYMRTSREDIFAVGDCVEHKDFFSGKPSRLMLASTAAAEARVAGFNLFNLKIVRHCKGSIAIFSSSLNDISMGAAGLTESQAEKEGFDIVAAYSEGIDRHPGKISDASKVRIKGIFSRGTGALLGAQITGGKSTGEMINILGLAIQKSMTASELSIMQYGTQPLLTSGPGVYPIVLCAMNALEKLMK